MSKSYEEFKIGNKFKTGFRKITEKDIDDFANFSWDKNELHTKEITQDHDKRRMSKIAHGLLVEAFIFGLIDKLNIFSDTAMAMASKNTVYMEKVFPEDVIMCVLEVKEKKDREYNRGMVIFECFVKNRNAKNTGMIIFNIIIKKKKDV